MGLESFLKTLILFFIGEKKLIIDTIVAGIIGGLGTGLGAAIGTYFAQKGVIAHIEKLDKKIKDLKEEKKND